MDRTAGPADASRQTAMVVVQYGTAWSSLFGALAIGRDQFALCLPLLAVASLCLVAAVVIPGPPSRRSRLLLSVVFAALMATLLLRRW